MLLGMPFYSFHFGITISPFFPEILGEMAHNTWSIYLVDEWSVLIPSVGISQWMWSVRDLYQESIKSISLGSQQFGKAQ
jgi:hypothetical protein